MSDIRIKMAKDLRDMSDMVGDLHWMAAKAVEDLIKKDARIAELEADRDSHQRCAIQAMAELAAAKPQVVMPEQWSKSFNECWPIDESDLEGDWVIGTVMRDGDEIYCPVISVEAAQYDAPGESEKIAKALVLLLNPKIEVARLNAAPAPVCKTCADSGCDPAFKALVPCSGCAAAPVQQVNVPDEREAFEREAVERYGYTWASIYSRRQGLGYSDSSLCMAWIMWQARAMLAAAPAAPAADAGMVEALEKLARLGNGDQYGNSDGNMIAQAALAAHRAATAPGGE